MHKRTAHRWRLMVMMGVAAAFALASFWLQQLVSQRDTDVQAEARRSEPDYIVENFSVVRMSAAGQPHYIMSGAKLTHRPIDDSSEVEQPYMQSMSAVLPPTTVHAQHAHVDHLNNVVQMHGAVDIERVASPTTTSMSLKTQSLTVLPDEDQMDSNDAVELTLGAATVRGVGMHADNASGKLHIASNGQMNYPPKPASKQ